MARLKRRNEAGVSKPANPDGMAKGNVAPPAARLVLASSSRPMTYLYAESRETNADGVLGVVGISTGTPMESRV